jgi:hypothetical protein
MTWCKGCKKDLSPCKFTFMISQFCDNCVDIAQDMCESREHCDSCPQKTECEES